MDRIKLKPCPFCGGSVEMTYTSYDNMYHIYHRYNVMLCTIKEPIDIDGYFVKSLSEAEDAWNRRAENG